MQNSMCIFARSNFSVNLLSHSSDILRKFCNCENIVHIGLPTTTAGMIAMEEAATKHILAAVAIDAENKIDEALMEDTTDNIDAGGRTFYSGQQHLSVTSMNDVKAEMDRDLSSATDTSTNNKGFIKMLHKAERYVADLDAYQQTRPKLSYSAMCALAIQVCCFSRG